LPWLSGTLLLGYIGEREAAEPWSGQADGAWEDPFPDDVLFLEFHDVDGTQQMTHRRSGYWTVFRKMEAMGMISGWRVLAM
jgi:hypothetical protein